MTNSLLDLDFPTKGMPPTIEGQSDVYADFGNLPNGLFNHISGVSFSDELELPVIVSRLWINAFRQVERVKVTIVGEATEQALAKPYAGLHAIGSSGFPPGWLRLTSAGGEDFNYPVNENGLIELPVRVRKIWRTGTSIPETWTHYRPNADEVAQSSVFAVW